MSISAKELAKKLNVSPATISMVLNNKSGISSATRDMILSAAAEYGYDLTRHAVHTEEICNICFIIYKKSGKVVADTPFFSDLTEGISNACKTENLNLSIMYLYGGEPAAPQLKALLEKEYHGILLLATEMSQEDFAPFLKLSCPLIVLDCYYENLPLDTVLINNVQGAYVATAHLAQSGFKKIGYLKSSFRIANFDERADGYYKALRHFQIKKDANFTLNLAPSMEGAYYNMKELLEQQITLADAYFADNDLIAAGAMRALQESGVRVPEDVSIIGFDDIPICNFLTPALSTMHVQKHDFGILAVEQIQSKIANPLRNPVKLELSTKLVSRSSVGRK